jgi:hypothetical protein
MALSLEQAFDVLLKAAEQSAQHKNALYLENAARSLGMAETEGTDVAWPRTDWRSEYSDGRVLHVESSWRDTSRTNQLRPDRHKIVVEILNNGEQGPSRTDTW